MLNGRCVLWKKKGEWSDSVAILKNSLGYDFPNMTLRVALLRGGWIADHDMRFHRSLSP